MSQSRLVVFQSIHAMDIYTKPYKDHIGKVWQVITVQKVIDMLKSKPKWILLKRCHNIHFDYLEAETPKVIVFTENKSLIILTLTPIIIRKYYVDSVQNLSLPEPIQVCVPNLPLKSLILWRKILVIKLV